MSKFDIKDRIDGVIYSAFNAFSDLSFLLSPRIKGIVAANARFRDRHHGQRCFIVATGPSLNSLREHQIDRLRSEVIIGVNSLYKASVADRLVPSYYSLLDNNYWGVSRGAFGEIRDKYAEQPPVFITDVRAVGVLQELGEEVDYIPIYTKNYPVRQMRYDLTGNLSISMNVVSASIQAAMFMGFSEIYLLGCDYTYFCSLSSLHCYDDEQERSDLPSYNLAFYLKYYHLTTEFHYLIARLAKQIGVKVINATDGSLLDAYPKVRLDDVL